MKVEVLEADQGHAWRGLGTTTLAAFARENELDADYVAEIRSELMSVGKYIGGGGAAPWWMLKRVGGRPRTRTRSAKLERSTLRHAIRRDS